VLNIFFFNIIIKTRKSITYALTNNIKLNLKSKNLENMKFIEYIYIYIRYKNNLNIKITIDFDLYNMIKTNFVYLDKSSKDKLAITITSSQ